MGTQFIHTVDTFSVFVGVVGVGIIIVGVVRGLKDFITLEIREKGQSSLDLIRYNLGTYLLLGLEFLVAADIIETVFKPSLEQLLILAGIVVIRTALNYFIGKELEQIGKTSKLK